MKTIVSTTTGSPVVPVNIEIDSPDNVIYLQRVTLNCSELFVEVAPAAADGAKTYRLQHSKSTKILHLQALDPLRTTYENYHEFLPKKIYVRECMQEIFSKLVLANDPLKYTVVFGSPGVGKSVLSFLAALCCVYFIKRPVLFLRKTTKKPELISVFWITLDDGKLTVEFDRGVARKNTLQQIFDRMIGTILADDLKAGNIVKFRKGKTYIRSICDGPRHDHADHVGKSDLVTSDGYETPKQEAMFDINSLPLSAWTQKEVIQACRSLFKTKVAQAKEMYDVCGGNIRMITAFLEQRVSLEDRREDMDALVTNEGSKEEWQLAFQSTSLSSTEDRFDRLRAMFATPSRFGYTTVQYIGTPYFLRLIRSELSLEETMKGLQYAKDSGIASLYGWHFELFGHKVFQVSHKRQVETSPNDSLQAPPNYHSFTIEEGRGTGKESVKQLTTSNVYWMPSTSNFANIDAAIVVNGIMYCVQYTVSDIHAFNLLTFISDFWSELPADFRQKITKIVVVFVVPRDTTFRKVVIPKSQESLSSCMTCEGGIELIFRKARSAAKGAEGEDDEHKMEEDDDDEYEANVTSVDEKNCDADDNDMDDDDEHDTDESMEESFSDDDCGEEDLFDEAEISRAQKIPLCVHFQWEKRSEDFDVETAPLTFLNLPSDPTPK